MSRHQRLIEQMNGVIDGVITERAAIEQIAIQYAEAVGVLQIRVAQGVDLARRGLRMELRSLVDAQPPLLKTAEQFSDTPSLSLTADDDDIQNHQTSVSDRSSNKTPSVWQMYCRENGLAIPPRISDADVSEIREAASHARADRFDQLHRLFRRQNLALASTSMRLETLRLIAKRDSKNPIWHEEIIRFENGLIQELRHSFAEAIEKGLLADAEQIIETLKNEEWRSAAEAQLAAAQFEVKMTTAWAKHATAHAARVAQEMFANYMAESIDKVRENLSQWNQFLERMERGGIEVPAEPLAMVTPILAWLDIRDAESERARETKARLEALERVAVDPTTSATDVQACLVAAEAMMAEVPAALREIAERRVQAHIAQMRIRRRMKMLGAVVVIAAALGGATWFTMDQIRVSKERAFIAALEGAVDRNDKDQIAKLLAESSANHTGFHQHPSSLAALKRQSDLLAREVEADKDFENLFAQAGDPTAISSNRSAVEAAANIARTDDQRERVRQWRQNQSIVEARAGDARNDAFLADVQKMGAEMNQLESLSPDDQASQAQLGQVERFAERIAAVGNIGQDARAAFEIQRARVRLFRTEVERAIAVKQLHSAEEAELAAIMAAVSLPEKLPDLFRHFATAFPNSPYALDFAEAAQNAEEWKGLSAWLELRKSFMMTPLPTTEVDRAVRRLEIQRFRAAYPKSAVDESVRTYEELMVENSDWVDWLNNTLRTWTPLSMRELVLHDGIRYFYDPTDQPLVTVAESKIYNVWQEWKNNKKVSIVVQRANIKSDGQSPQERLKERVDVLLRGRDARISAEGALEIIRIIRDDADTDPAIRATLIDGLLPKVQPAVPYLKAPFERSTKLLADANLDAIDWIAPGIPSSRKDWKRLNELLRLDIPVADWSARRQSQMTAVLGWLKCDLRAVGIIDQIGEGQHIRLATDARLQPHELLYVVTAGPTITTIGTVHAGGIPQFAGALRNVPSGTPVFAGAYRPIVIAP